MYSDENSFLMSTGLKLKEISEILCSSETDEEVEKKLKGKGEKYLRRYQLIKIYKEMVSSGEMKLSIVPIIAALPCVGKTTISREIATALGIGNVMGGDAIRASYRELIDENEHPEFFCSIYGAWQFVGDKKETEENIIKGFYAQAKIMNDLMERIVADRGVRDGESMVVEYLHFLPSQYDPNVLNHPSVIPIVLRLESMDEWKRRIDERDRTSHLKGNSQRLIPALEKYKKMQEVQCEDAKKIGVPIITSDNMDEALDKVLDIIFDRIEKLIELKDVKEESIEKLKKVEKERALNPDEKR